MKFWLVLHYRLCFGERNQFFDFWLQFTGKNFREEVAVKMAIIEAFWRRRPPKKWLSKYKSSLWQHNFTRNPLHMPAFSGKIFMQFELQGMELRGIVRNAMCYFWRLSLLFGIHLDCTETSPNGKVHLWYGLYLFNYDKHLPVITLR